MRRRNRLQRGRFLLLLAVPWAAPAVAQAPLTFREALDLTQLHNEHWRAADVHVSRFDQMRAAQRGLFWPSVGVIGGYSHLNDRLFVDLPELRSILMALNPEVPVPPLSATVLRNDPVKISLSASWTVFDGGRILAANRAAQAELEAAEAEREGAHQGIITELVDRYFGRRLAADVLEVWRHALATFDQHLDDARRLQAAGQIARTEELRAEVARSEADRDYRKAARDVDLASAALRATLGIDENVTPVTELTTVAELETLDQYLGAADAQNPELDRLAAIKEQSRQGIATTRAEYLPVMRLFGLHELYEERLNSTTDPKWILGVELEWQLFDGFGRGHRVSAARLAERESNFRLEGARRDIRTLVQSRYDDYASALEQYTSLQSSLELATESLRSEQLAFAEGVGTSLAVVDAELSLSRIQVGRLTAQYDMIVALARLLEASGQSDKILEYIQ